MRRFVCIALLLASGSVLGQQPAAHDSNSAAAQVGNDSSQEKPAPQTTPQAIENYAPYSIALLPGATGGEVVLPFMTSENKLIFFRVSEVQQASREKRSLGRPISYGEVIALIGQLQLEVNRLQQENDKLWAVVTKQPGPQTVVLQPPQQQGPSAAELQAEHRQRMEDQKRQMLMMFLLGQQPQRVNMNLNVRDCSRFPALCVQ